MPVHASDCLSWPAVRGPVRPVIIKSGNDVMSRIQEPGQQQRQLGSSWRAPRASNRPSNPNLRLHVRPLSSTRKVMGQGRADPEASLNRTAIASTTRLPNNVRNSLDHLYKKIDLKRRVGLRVPASPAIVGRSQAARDSSAASDCNQIEGSPRKAVHDAVSRKEVGPGPEPLLDVPSPEPISTESETLSAWQTLQLAFQKFESSATFWKPAAADSSNADDDSGVDKQTGAAIDIGGCNRPHEGDKAAGDLTQGTVGPEHDIVTMIDAAAVSSSLAEKDGDSGGQTNAISTEAGFENAAARERVDSQRSDNLEIVGSLHGSEHSHQPITNKADQCRTENDQVSDDAKPSHFDIEQSRAASGFESEEGENNVDREPLGICCTMIPAANGVSSASRSATHSSNYDADGHPQTPTGFPHPECSKHPEVGGDRNSRDDATYDDAAVREFSNFRPEADPQDPIQHVNDPGDAKRNGADLQGTDRNSFVHRPNLQSPDHAHIPEDDLDIGTHSGNYGDECLSRTQLFPSTAISNDDDIVESINVERAGGRTAGQTETHSVNAEPSPGLAADSSTANNSDPGEGISGRIASKDNQIAANDCDAMEDNLNKRYAGNASERTGSTNVADTIPAGDCHSNDRAGPVEEQGRVSIDSETHLNTVCSPESVDIRSGLSGDPRFDHTAAPAHARIFNDNVVGETSDDLLACRTQKAGCAENDAANILKTSSEVTETEHTDLQTGDNVAEKSTTSIFPADPSRECFDPESGAVECDTCTDHSDIFNINSERSDGEVDQMCTHSGFKDDERQHGGPTITELPPCGLIQDETSSSHEDSSSITNSMPIAADSHELVLFHDLASDTDADVGRKNSNMPICTLRPKTPVSINDRPEQNFEINDTVIDAEHSCVGRPNMVGARQHKQEHVESDKIAESDDIHQMKCSKLDADSTGRRPKAVLYRRRYRRKPSLEGSRKPSLEDRFPKVEHQPEDDAAKEDSTVFDNRARGVDSITLGWSCSCRYKIMMDQAVDAMHDRCCRETRCVRCPVSADQATESTMSGTDVETQCHTEHEDREVQCRTEAASAVTQTVSRESVEQSIQTEQRFRFDDNSTQTNPVGSEFKAVQCCSTTRQSEAQTERSVEDAEVQCHEPARPAGPAVKPSTDQRFSDLDQHVDQFIRSISPSRSFLHERQKRQYIESIEDPAKGVIVLDDGRPLKNAGPSGPRSLVSLNIGGQRFDVLRSTLSRYPETLLGRIANSPLPVYIDRSPVLFPFIIDTFRTGSPYVPSGNQSCTYLESLRDEAQFYQIEKEMFPNGIQGIVQKEVKIPTENNSPSEDDEGQYNQFELCEQYILEPGMSATFIPRTNETLVLDTISGRGQLLLDAEHADRPELSVNGAVVFDSAAYLNSSDGERINIETAYPHGASYTFFMSDRRQSFSRNSTAGKRVEEEVCCEFCGLVQRIDLAAGRLPLCSSCHAQLPENHGQLSIDRSVPGFPGNTRVEHGEQLTITIRIICTFDKTCCTKVATVKKGNVAVLSKVLDSQYRLQRERSPGKKPKKTPMSVNEKQQPLKQPSEATSGSNRRTRPSPLPLIRRPPMA